MLKSLINKVINESQFTFVKGRQNLDDILMANEAMYNKIIFIKK